MKNATNRILRRLIADSEQTIVAAEGHATISPFVWKGVKIALLGWHFG
jgi:hypothetical protein